jgi:hypothetical protein
MSNETRTTADRALADYLAMGRDRSLRKLAQRYTEARTEHGTLGNLRYWSRTHGWADRAREHDAQVAGEVSTMAIEAQAEETWDAAKALMVSGRRVTETLDESLVNVRAQDPAGLKALAEVAAMLLKLAGDLERGQATGADAQQAVDEAEDRLSGAEVIELWRRRHSGGDKGHA